MLVEQYYWQFHSRVASLLEETRASWVDDGEERPGTAAAWEVSQKLEEEGLYVSAVHPSADEEDNWTGPRFYISIVPSAIQGGPAPRPPKEVEELLWPRPRDRLQPWITELGWTMVPEGSNEQTLHADILSWEEEPSRPRKDGLGRFHHFLWKPSRRECCTTKIVHTAFTEGSVEDWHYDSLSQVQSPSLVLDSEVLHCGSATRKGCWSSTCTIQLCSARGWRALHADGRATQDLLWYVWPIEEAPLKRPAAPSQWHRDAQVEALWEDGYWYAARIVKRQKDGRYKVRWEGEDTVASGFFAAHLRARQLDDASSAERPRSGKRRRRE